MKIKTATDIELVKMFRDEINKVNEYEDIFDYMTTEEKEELREWMAHGKSVNDNPYLICGENGCPLDLIAAKRLVEAMIDDLQQPTLSPDVDECGTALFEPDEYTHFKKVV